ncbi:MAG: Type-2 restriction enzyme HincII [candidate division WS2 bacterium]|uniref:Type-2 restriction enzyme HincII n=1 Tax=Psychracetigena formicireducens TaxID=2986056 RepID=A0A9E2BHS7_PSYF1|nr:Type-2 restriction enzyme HincII [Candidatus Psychracetigena formicireducens]
MNYSFLESEMIGKTVDKPVSGTLSGHAAGEPFDKLVNSIIRERYPYSTYRQFEYLNKLFSDNSGARSYTARTALFPNPTLAFLLNRGKSAVEKWSLSNLFEEKQNDTTDIVLIKDDSIFHLIDVKTRNIDKKAQPPNIISAYKLAQMCAYMIDNDDFNTFDIIYVEVDWKVDRQYLKCTNAVVREMFKADPATLYINWAAALQIQFHVCDLDQSYSGQKNWCYDYLRYFVKSTYKRTVKMKKQFAEPFEKYVRNDDSI